MHTAAIGRPSAVETESSSAATLSGGRRARGGRNILSSRAFRRLVGLGFGLSGLARALGKRLAVFTEDLVTVLDRAVPSM